MRKLLILALFSLTACGPTVVKDRPVRVNVPVTQPCATTRPEPPLILKQAYPDAQWAEMDVKMKAAAVGRQTLLRQSYGEQLYAATAACPEVK